MSAEPATITDNRTARFDVAIVGAGSVGLALAIALAQAGLDTALIGPPPPSQAGRTVALLDGSARLMAALGVWPHLVAEAAPLRTMRIVDATPSLFRAPPVSFPAAELGLPAFGYNVGNDALVSALAAVADGTPGLTRDLAWVEGHKATAGGAAAILHGGGRRDSTLLIAADGAGSALREGAGIGVREHRYPQVALTAVLHHSIPHADISTEFHTRQGPFTLVPMAAQPGQPCRSSLVWVMEPAAAERRSALAPAELARAIERQSRGILGKVTLGSAVGRFPIRRRVADRLVGPRLALVGEAAHALPPIGAQGLNLSLRDAATLVDILVAAHRAGGDIGAPAVLARYETARRGDIALRGGSVHALNMALLSPLWPVDALRGLGLRALGALKPLRDAVMREGLRPQAAVPALMRGSLPTA